MASPPGMCAHQLKSSAIPARWCRTECHGSATGTRRLGWGEHQPGAGYRQVDCRQSKPDLSFIGPRRCASKKQDLHGEHRRIFAGSSFADLANELGLDLATVLPGAFGGPGFQRNTPSIDFVETIMAGALRLGAPPFNYPWVDVRDVAEAHRLVLDSGARGRFAAVNDLQPTVTEIAHAMHALDRSVPEPMMTLPTFLMPLLPWLEAVSSRIDGTARSLTPELAGTLKGRIWNISNAKIRRELGWAPRFSLEQSLADTMTAIRAQAARKSI